MTWWSRRSWPLLRRAGLPGSKCVTCSATAARRAARSSSPHCSPASDVAVRPGLACWLAGRLTGLSPRPWLPRSERDDFHVLVIGEAVVGRDDIPQRELQADQVGDLGRGAAA